MRVDFNSPLLGLDGKPISVPGEDGKPAEIMTLGIMSINVLLSSLVDERTGNPEVTTAVDKVRFAKLAQDIYAAKGPIDLLAEDIALLKERIGRAGAPLAVARAWELLDPIGKSEDDHGNTASDRALARQAKARK